MNSAKHHFSRSQNKSYLKNREHVPCFCQVIKALVEVWQNEQSCGNTGHRSVSRAFTSSPKLSRVFLYLNRNMKNIFSISFRKHHDEKKKGRQFLSFDLQIVNWTGIVTSTACATSVFYQVIETSFLTNQCTCFLRAVL